MIKQIVLTLTLFCLVNTLYAQQTINKTLVHDGNTRAYTVYIPASYDGTSNVPLLFNFHGGSGNISSQIAISDMRPIADTANFILVYPQAWPDPSDGNSTNWTHKAPTTHNDVFFVDAMIDSLSSAYNINTNRVYACGYSNGGEFTFELACQLGNRISSIGVVARSMYIETLNQCTPSHPTAVVTIHGTNDDYNGITFAGITYYPALSSVNDYWTNYNNTYATPTITQLPNINSSDGSTVEHHTWENGDGCVSVEHFKVLGGGHDWPGSFGNMDIDASAEIWNFVSKYNLDGLIGCSTISIEEIDQDNKAITLYPNPVSNEVTINIDLDHVTHYDIYSSVGKAMLSGTINQQNHQINVSKLSSGLYILKADSYTVKFLKQ